MKKLFELSVRGSVYFYLSTISEEQMFKLKQFASQFYRSNPVYENKPDDEIAEYFTASAKQKFDIELESIPVSAVFVINKQKVSEITNFRDFYIT